jgi:hypothetical protein
MEMNFSKKVDLVEKGKYYNFPRISLWGGKCVYFQMFTAYFRQMALLYISQKFRYKYE